MKLCESVSARVFSLFLAAAAVATSAGATTVTFSDGAFTAANWTVTVEILNGGGTGSGLLVASGGSPGAYRRTTNTTNTAAAGVSNSVFVFHKFAGATYDPSVSGPILSIDYAEDSMRITGGVQACALAIRQGGVIYYGPIFLNPTSFNVWATTTQTGLVASQFDALAAGVQNPNFTASGGPIEFGFLRGNSTSVGGPGGTTVGGIDDWTVTVNVADPIATTPSTWGHVKAVYRK